MRQRHSGAAAYIVYVVARDPWTMIYEPRARANVPLAQAITKLNETIGRGSGLIYRESRHKGGLPSWLPGLPGKFNLLEN
jgi:hypothetical protein